MPVYNGSQTLQICLRPWFEQTMDDFELVIVDNCSSDDSFEVIRSFIENELKPAERRKIRLFTEDKSGQSAASNRALAESRGNLLVWTAQDMLVKEDFLSGHHYAHSKHNRGGEKLAILGFIKYPDTYLEDPFMGCLVDETVFQFGYCSIGDPLDANPRCLYAPNFSINRRSMLDLGGFDENFPYGWQDTDFGLRLKNCGGRIVYQASLVAEHLHPLTWKIFCRRMEKVGRDYPAFINKHPQFESYALLRKSLRAYFLEARSMVSAAQKIALIFDKEPDSVLPKIRIGAGNSKDTLSAAYVLLMKYHFYKGFYDGGRKFWGKNFWTKW
jgi:GT2 family glycosyltransferase